jgi:hypothetical protein
MSDEEKEYFKMCGWIFLFVLLAALMLHCGSTHDMKALLSAPATYQGIPPTDAEIAAALADYEAQ